jgi:hypothetical protein
MNPRTFSDGTQPPIDRAWHGWQDVSTTRLTHWLDPECGGALACPMPWPLELPPVAPIPEPGTLGMLALGLVAIGLWLRHRERRNAGDRQ